jgi:hypothetical protein
MKTPFQSYRWKRGICLNWVADLAIWRYDTHAKKGFAIKSIG